MVAGSNPRRISLNIKCFLLSVLRSRFVLVNVYKCSFSVIASLLLCATCAIIILTYFPVFHNRIIHAWLCVFYRDSVYNCMYNPTEKLPIIN